MGQMTFPSKTIELAAHGLLLISAAVSDVPKVFPGQTACLLEDEQPATLAQLLVWLEAHRNAASSIAQNGQHRVHQLCGIENVGRSLKTFLDAEGIN